MRAQRVICKLCGSRGSIRNKREVQTAKGKRWICNDDARWIATEYAHLSHTWARPREGDTASSKRPGQVDTGGPQPSTDPETEDPFTLPMPFIKDLQ